ncbi:hypothetical protein Y032_0007g3284 [Ancylostoma ceylanicum]|uniref:Uncharacterized protein n=1 Tax=Ancylostoma ceylanicum TaxID=53326 RepID=A0A016VLV8_9BILA|nr:hypothetical protein Y032_0007g3284 [Ancylostoma ceylanicum]
MVSPALLLHQPSLTGFICIKMLGACGTVVRGSLRTHTVDGSIPRPWPTKPSIPPGSMKSHAWLIPHDGIDQRRPRYPFNFRN